MYDVSHDVSQMISWCYDEFLYLAMIYLPHFLFFQWLFLLFQWYYFLQYFFFFLHFQWFFSVSFSFFFILSISFFSLTLFFSLFFFSPCFFTFFLFDSSLFLFLFFFFSFKVFLYLIFLMINAEKLFSLSVLLTGNQKACDIVIPKKITVDTRCSLKMWARLRIH